MRFLLILLLAFAASSSPISTRKAAAAIVAAASALSPEAVHVPAGEPNNQMDANRQTDGKPSVFGKYVRPAAAITVPAMLLPFGYNSVSKILHKTHGAGIQSDQQQDFIDLGKSVPEVIADLKPIFRNFKALAPETFEKEASFRARLAETSLVKLAGMTKAGQQGRFVSVAHRYPIEVAFELVAQLIKEIGGFQETKIRCVQCSQQMGIALSKLLVSGRILSSRGEKVRELCADYLYAAVYPRPPLRTGLIQLIEAFRNIDSRSDLEDSLRSEMVGERDALKNQIVAIKENLSKRPAEDPWEALIQKHKIELASGYLQKL